MRIKIVDKIIRRFLDYKTYQNDSQYFLKWKNWESVVSKWDKYASPFKLSGGDVRNYEAILKRTTSKEKVLILGATPEIRDLAAKMNLNVIVADFSLKMLKGMLDSAKYKARYKEKWIIADWLDLDRFLKNNYFDVILGDLVLRNIEPELQSDFLDKISKLMTPEAFFITRIHFVNENLLNFDINNIIAEVFDKNFNLGNNFLEDLIASRLFDRNTDFKQHSINKISFAKNIYDYLKNFKRNKREEIVLNNVLRKWSGEMTWTQRTKKEINDFLEKNFKIVNTETPLDYKDSEFYPIYTLKDNKNS